MNHVLLCCLNNSRNLGTTFSPSPVVITSDGGLDDPLLGEALGRVQRRAEPDLGVADIVLDPEAGAEVPDGLRDGVLRLQELVAEVEDAPVPPAPHGVVGAGGELPVLQAQQVFADSLGGNGELDARLIRLFGDEI